MGIAGGLRRGQTGVAPRVDGSERGGPGPWAARNRRAAGEPARPNRQGMRARAGLCSPAQAAIPIAPPHGKISWMSPSGLDEICLSLVNE